MKKLCLLLLVGIICVSLVGCQGHKQADFEGSHWGDKREQVVKTHEEEASETNQAMVLYQTNRFGLDCTLKYVFNDQDQLMVGFYSFSNTELEAKTHVSDFKRIDKELQHEYGTPKSQEPVFAEGTDENDGTLEELLAEGKVSFKTKWIVGETEIIHTLSRAASDQVTHEISYGSVKLLKEWKEK